MSSSTPHTNARGRGRRAVRARTAAFTLTKAKLKAPAYHCRTVLTGAVFGAAGAGKSSLIKGAA